jgi:hypothetical protein
MAEYRIVAKVDPQTAAGSNKVKQDLRGIQNEARATETALNRSFDQGKFDQTIGKLVQRIEQLDSSIKGLAGSNSTLTRSNETLGQSLDRMAASQGKATTQTQAGGKAAGDAASKNAQYEAALMRVLRAVDQDAAEQARLNALLVDAKKLLDAGIISQERYAQVQKLAAQQTADLNVKTGAQRIGMQQLGFQLGDIATMYSLGAKPAQIFASQIGQVTQAVQLMSGGTSKFAAFLGGPWGIALSVGLILLAPFVAKLWEGNDALADAIDKLRKDAQETELNRRAKEAFNRTLEGQIALQRELNAELEKGIQSQRQQQQQALRESENRLQRMRDSRGGIVDQITEAENRVKELNDQLRSPPPFGADESYTLGLIMALDRAETKAKQLRDTLAQRDRDIAATERGVRAARVPIQEDAAQAAADPIAGINRQYDIMRDRAVAAALANEQLSQALAGTLTNIEKQRRAAVEAAQAQQQLARATRDGAGVATFRSREQAIGIAGREFQQSGLRVSQNEQFGGVTGNHPGMGNTAHGKYAIDVNSGSGIVEANVPELKAQFDAAARRYQSRGYRVLWNGWVYEANGSGPTRRIPAGQNQHNDHMHLEAPSTIVGKPTRASDEAQYQREEGASTKVQERAEDFVSAIQTRAASVGLPADRQTQLNAQIDEALAEFNRRFDREASPDEAASIRKAFTDADARETALRFDDAYVKPLQRLQALQGTTGVDREVLNAKLDETLRLGRELTPVEAEMIENGIRQGDQLNRQAQLLQQIKGPLQEYAAQIEALNALLAAGDINQRQYNSRIAEMAQAAAGAASGLPGVDPGTGRNYEDVGKIADENARYAKQLEDFANYREQLVQMGVDYDALELAARQQHVDNLNAIDKARKDVQLAAAEEIWGSITGIAENAFGKQSAIYKAAFATEKAVAIARSIVAIQTGIAQASALPFPANLGAMASVAAATASIVSNISSVVLAFKDGGYVSGPGGPRSDSVPARLSNGEFVVNSRATANNRPLLEAINSGQQVRQATAASAAEARTMMQPAAPVVVPPAQVNQRFVNVLDPSIVGDYLATPDGEEQVVNKIRRNPEVVRGAGNER